MFLTGVLCYITGIFILKERIWDMKENTALRKRILAALFLAIGLILPFITMQIPTVGKCFARCTYRCYYVDISADGHMACLLGLLHLF